MGWKGTTTITREAAIREILARVGKASNSQLADTLEDLIASGAGDELSGLNFIVEDDNAGREATHDQVQGRG